MNTFKEVYKLPFEKYSFTDTWAYDQNNNFCFQFEFNSQTEVNGLNLQELLLKVINGKETLKNPDLKFTHRFGEIKDSNDKKYITIRGWGNLTSPNCLNFSDEEASNIQDTLAEYIVERLNKREVPASLQAEDSSAEL